MLRSRGRRVADPQPSWSGAGEAPFGPPTQEEAAMAAVTRRLRGWTDRIQAFAQDELEQMRELVHAVLVCSSLFVFSLWGRASAPTGCSPRDSGQLCNSWAKS